MIDPRKLPRVGVISNTEKDFFGKVAELSGKSVLCVGFSEEEVEMYVERYNPKRIVLLTNWSDHVDAKILRYPLVIGDITVKTDFSDDEFDAVLTLSVLEHLSDLHGAFAEMTRIVKSGGDLIHMFGPAWSSAYGHHLYCNPNEALLNFSRWDMPAHIHLLCTHDQIAAFYLDHGFPLSVADEVLHWFFEAPIINRVFYDDYLAILSDKSYQLDFIRVMHNTLPLAHSAMLRERYPGRNDFSSYGFKCRLIVRK
jgi:SAM-dependent methyltransferase